MTYETIETLDVKKGDFVLKSGNEVVQVGEDSSIYNVNLFYSDGGFPTIIRYRKIVGPKEALDLLRL